MFSKKNNISRALRFKEWKRKSYAAFHSIGKHITIGNIKNVIADTLLRKQKNMTATFDYVLSFSNDKTPEENEDPLFELLFLKEGVLITQQEKRNNGYLIQPLFLCISQMAESSMNTTFSHFYFQYKK